MTKRGQKRQQPVVATKKSYVKKSYNPKICKNDGCKKEFVPNIGKQVYCSRECFKAVNYKQLVLAKKELKEEQIEKFQYEKPIVKDSLEPIKRKRYKKRGRKKLMICKNQDCKKEFKQNSGKHLFCSPSCWSKNNYKEMKRLMMMKKTDKIDTSVFPSITQEPLVPQIQEVAKIKKTTKKQITKNEKRQFSKTNFFVLIFLLLITLILNFDKFVIILNKFVAWD